MKIVIEKNETIQCLISDMKMTAVAETREIDTKIPTAAAILHKVNNPLVSSRRFPTYLCSQRMLSLPE